MSDGLNFLNIENKLAPVKPAKPARNQTIIFTALVSILLGLVLRSQLMGWLFIIAIIPYLVVCLIHFLIHLKASRYLTRTLTTLLIASNVYLLVAFLLQWDIGDTDFGWLIITWIFGRHQVSQFWSPITSICVFVPEFVLLFFIFRLKLKEQKRLESEQYA